MIEPSFFSHNKYATKWKYNWSDKRLILIIFKLILFMAEKEADRLVDIALSNIKDDDYVHRGFLKPIEIALKTYKT